MTLWGHNIVYWFFAMCFASSVGVSLVSLERIRKQLNLVLPPDRQMSLHPPMPHSFGELFWKTNLLVHSLEILDQHKNHYPSSSMRKTYGIALIVATLSFIGFFASSLSA